MGFASASPTSSRTLSEASDQPEEEHDTNNNEAPTLRGLDAKFPRAQDNTLDTSADKETEANILDQYAQDMLRHGTHCEWDLSGEDLSGSEYTAYKKAKAAKTTKATAEQTLKTEPEDDIYYGNLPLIDVWLAKGKGYTQEQVSQMEGFNSTRNGQDDGDCEAPIVQVGCDGGGNVIFGSYLDDIDDHSQMLPLPTEEDAEL
jgi:hypothetical protein